MTKHLPKLYYGWIVAWALAISQPVSWGILFYGFGVMVTPTQAEMGWSRAELTGAFSLAMLISGITAVPVGRWLDRHGARGLMTVGSILATLLVIAWAKVTSLWGFYLVWAGIGVIMAGVLYEPAFAVIATWFVRKRTRALTVLTFGGGLASVIFVPLATWLVARYGWREALLILAGLLALVTIPIHALLLRRDPAAVGSVPDGDLSPLMRADGTQHQVAVNRSVGEAMRSANFWWLSTAFSLSVFAAVTLSVHLLPFLTERGYSASFAALVASTLGGSQIPGRLVFAPISQRLSLRLTTAMLFIAMTSGVLILFFAPTSWLTLVGAALFGAGSGASSPARAALVAELYGVKNYGSINGMIALAQTIAKAIAPVGMGLLYSWWGGYAPVFWTLAAASVGAVGSILFLSSSSSTG
ncbi:MAG: MFS transporter [Caldilineaceae bacterium]